MKSVTHALQMTEEISEFANYHGNEELSNTLFKVSDILRDLKIREPQKHTRIDSYFFYQHKNTAFENDNHPMCIKCFM